MAPVFSQRDLGFFVLQKIADRLDGGNVPTKKGKQWYGVTISKILNNSLYAGVLG